MVAPLALEGGQGAAAPDQNRAGQLELLPAAARDVLAARRLGQLLREAGGSAEVSVLLQRFAAVDRALQAVILPNKDGKAAQVCTHL
jgi:hypothetical protein